MDRIQVFFWGALGAPLFLSQLSLAQTPTPNSPKENVCSARPIVETKESVSAFKNTFADIYQNLESLENAFLKQDKIQFRKLIHPAIHKTVAEKNALLEDTSYDFGIRGVKLSRTAVYEIEINNPSDLNVRCGSGVTVRALAGPTNQVVSLHSTLGNEEQVRLFTIWIGIPKSLAEQKKISASSAIAHFHSQMWTHGKKSPALILEDAKSFAAEKDWLTSWMLAQGALRILSANPYFILDETEEAQKLSDKTRQEITEVAKAKENLAKLKTDWTFEDFTVVYGSKGLEAGVKFRMEKEVTFKELGEKCKAATRAVMEVTSQSLRKRFSGAQCLAYQLRENMAEAPDSGSQFFSWKDLGL